MSNYIKATNFTVKDALNTGDPAKIIKGTEIDVEFTAVASAVSSKADTNSPTFTGTPLAPTAASGTSNTQVATTSFVATAVAASFPSGGIIMWSGSIAAIPSGWVICDGTNSTPDLRDRFVVGAGSSYAVSSVNSLSAKDAVVVSHSHSASSSAIGDHAHSAGYTNGSFGDAGAGVPLANFGPSGSTMFATTGSGAHNHSISVASAGVSGTNANLPPYYALAYIMKV